jgi:hypothetical protein
MPDFQAFETAARAAGATEMLPGATYWVARG